MIARIWRRSLVRGLGVAARYNAAGARVHPRARFDGRRADITVARGVTISERCVIAVHPGGSIHLGPNVWLNHDCELETDGRIRIGADTTVQRRSSLNGNVLVGEGCIIAPNVFVSSGTHLQMPEVMEDSAPDRPVVIGDHCWLGVNVVVMPGVTIGHGSVVGANSVVTHDVEPRTIVAGAPARPIGEAHTTPR